MLFRSLYLGGATDTPSFINLDRFQLVKSFLDWPRVQIFEISLVEPDQTALVVEHENYGGKEWISLLSEDYLVDVVNDDEDLTFHFTGNYKIIVLADLRRTLSTEEFEILQQEMSEGAVLIICGLTPAYLDLDNNAYWIGANKFVEAPKEAKWEISFTENSFNISTEIELTKQYAYYTNGYWSSPTGMMGIEEDVLVLATRIEDKATAIYAKHYLNGTVIFSGIRLPYAKYSEDYEILIDFLESLREKATNNKLFS